MSARTKACVFLDGKSMDGELFGFDVFNVQVIRQSRVIGAPVESGTTSFDNKVIDPVKVVVNGVVNMATEDAEGVMSSIDDMFRTRDFKFFGVSDGVSCYGNLILQGAPHKRSPEKFDLVSFELTFIEALFVQSQEASPLDSSNTNTRSNGFVAGKSV